MEQPRREYMANVLLLYVSQTGNTEIMAEEIAGFLEYNAHDVEIKTFDFDPIDIDELSEYDLVLIGTHSNDDGYIPFEAEDFFDDLEEANLEGTVFGVFGSGDTAYDEFCLSVDIMGDRLQELGAEVIPDRCKVDLMPTDEDIAKIEQFAASGIAKLEA